MSLAYCMTHLFIWITMTQCGSWLFALDGLGAASILLYLPHRAFRLFLFRISLNTILLIQFDYFNTFLRFRVLSSCCSFSLLQIEFDDFFQVLEKGYTMVNVWLNHGLDIVHPVRVTGPLILLFYNNIAVFIVCFHTLHCPLCSLSYLSRCCLFLFQIKIL